MSDLIAPNGSVITGTNERLTGVALIQCAKVENGRVVFEYEGTTEIDWDSQKTDLLDGEIIFIAEDGTQWTEEELVDAAKEQKEEA